jgi:hypothetical protein
MAENKKYMESIDLFDPEIKRLFDKTTGDEVSQKQIIKEIKEENQKQLIKNQTKLF